MGRVTSGETILQHLRAVSGERALRAADPALAAAVDAIKRYQQRRFAHTYRDLLADPRYAAAARFFLDELYGPADYARRDDQFARIVPALTRLFPRDIVDTVALLAHLHALAERLDTAMGRQLVAAGPASGNAGAMPAAAPAITLTADDYVQAWQRTGDPDARERQIALTQQIGGTLDRLTRNPLLRHSLRMMRAPARAAGLEELQRFLETGFDTFREMRGAASFLARVGTQERALARALFEAQGPVAGTPLADALPG